MSLSQFLFAILRHGQKFLVYPSAFVDHPRDVTLPSEIGLQYEEVELRTSDKVILRCFLMRYTSSATEDNLQNQDSTKSLPRATIIMFHGNGMNHGDTVESAEQFVQRQYNVLTLSYRGYGHSEGSPSEKGLRIDAQTALNYVLGESSLSQTPVILYGQSPGGAVAIDLASRNPSKIHALIVENTFTSLPNVVRDWPYVGNFSFICSQKWNSASKLPRMPTSLPILMLSGDRDEVVPKEHMHKLWDQASIRCKNTGKTKRKENAAYSPPQKDMFKSFPYGSHASTYVQPGYWETVAEFLQTLDH
ncbi:Alpha/Beta hydrolase protein [Crucibulum laeve]|uniref:Alpha/Beta hydrolase protein n=1 Tax=Crucibulum laeve TaxID=68775 RepID=A0A5C3LHC6_9AGAR|nr:Alpha/Beta hydrolase protein [Crucibulum laeve]